MPEDAFLAWFPSALIPALWLGWAIYWAWSALDVKATARRESFVSRWLHLGPLLLAAALMCVPVDPWPLLQSRFLPRTEAASGIGAALTVAGIAFAVWARRRIGRNWSVEITVKQDHELVTAGPYAWVRHPIYAGLLLAFIGSVLALGQWRGVLAFAIVVATIWRKLRIEERWMRERFGPAYDDYARRVKALVPFVI